MNMDAIKTEYQEELALVENSKQLGDFWAKFLGKGGKIQGLMGGIKSVPKEEKKAYGQAVNEIKNWAQKMQLPPTKFLIPLSYATILGGVCTLIGTSTNLVVNGLVVDGIAEGIVKNGHPLSMFELGRVGIFIALTGLFYLIMVSRYLLPSKRVADIENSDNSNPDYVRVEAMLSTRFPGLGKTLREFDFYRH